MLQLLGWERRGARDPGPNSSYRDLIGEQVLPSSDTGIGPSTLYLRTTYQHRIQHRGKCLLGMIKQGGDLNIH